jgi:hypothetical protein
MNTETIRLPASEIRKCRRCGGSGTVAHKHVLGGVCFGCSGSGWVRKVARAPVDNRIFSMTIWPSGMATASTRATSVGATEFDNEATYAAPASILARAGVTEADLATIDDETDAARRTREAFIAAAEKYGWR